MSIELESPVLAILTVQFKSTTHTFNIDVELWSALPEKIYKTEHIQDIYHYVDDPYLIFSDNYDFVNRYTLDKEYLAAYNATGTYCHYVEDGTADFTNGNRVIEQYIHGQAHLSEGAENNADLTTLSTILSEELNIKLSEKGLQNFLSLQTQSMSDTGGQRFDFNGPYGAYYWEMFFHIPFLIANHLNANQDFKGAKWWYERIFDPTSSEKPDATKPAEHYWQFREFRNLDITKLKDILSDEASIAVYRNDPFDPHAIARLRISAYQKAVVMKYIDNLLDWGDFLFTQDTQESIVEADMLYQLAQDILGKQPEKAGQCKTADDEDINFEKMDATENDGSEFLIHLENIYGRVKSIGINDKDVLARSKYLSKLQEELGANTATPAKFSDWVALSNATLHADLAIFETSPTPGPLPVTDKPKSKIVKYALVKELGYKPATVNRKMHTDVLVAGNNLVYGYGPTRQPATDIILKSKLAFCIPVNDFLLEYWDRVADRLFKIRNCMNISGVRRSLALYQPPIDPMLLVRAKAAGLSLEEILAGGITTPKLPNYRFVYMLEKAKQFVQNLQGFGGALLSALEKKDGEELTLLRSVHERNILRLTTDIKSKQLQEAQKQYSSIEESLANIQNRVDYYKNLVDEGLSGWEITQQVSKHAALGVQTITTAFYGQSSLLSLLPQLGSPFSLNYGGQQLSDSPAAWADMLRNIAAVFESVSSSAGLESGFQRRKEEWNFQLLTAKQDLKQSTLQLLAADLRVKIAERDQEIHEKTIEQSDEVHEFLQDKFTSLGLYNYMATSLNRLYRMSFSMALDMAKLAETCYRFETFDEALFIENDNWQNDRAGLLSGERLMLQLNRMEQSYMDKYKRCPEITQHFSLAIIDAGELLKLKQTGKCKITIPEIAFDILYPGQYRRLIKGVRISIPSIAGPYTNISANLKLTGSNVRINEADADLTASGVGQNSSITTSSAINDSGTFEFNFRDERYLPFEYAGAVSDWELSLPSKIRSFNYNSISDVIIHLSYTSLEGDREAGENKVVNALEDFTQSNGLFKAVSLKYEFPDLFYKLLSSETQVTEFKLTGDFFPYFLMDKDLSMSEVKIYLKPKRNMAVTIPQPGVLKLNEVNAEWDPREDLPGTGSEIDMVKGGTVALTGSPLLQWKIDAGVNGINKENLEDILVLIKYGIG